MTRPKIMPEFSITKEVMTDEDWKLYEQKRQTLDVFVSEDDQFAAIEKAEELKAQGASKEEVEKVLDVLPGDANVMLSLKHQFGFKAVWDFNLSEAKEAYPDEF
jgi:hypothetical protein